MTLVQLVHLQVTTITIHLFNNLLDVKIFLLYLIEKIILFIIEEITREKQQVEKKETESSKKSKKHEKSKRKRQ